MRHLKRILVILVILGALVGSFWAGYSAGLAAGGPDRRALMVIRRSGGESVGTSATWFDFSKPADVARFRKAEERLKANGAEYYVAKGIVEATVVPEPDPRRVNSHR